MSNKYEYEQFKEMVQSCNTLSEVCEKLNIGITTCNKNTIKKYIDSYNIDVEHFYKKNSRGQRVKELSEILKEDSNYATSHLKDRLYREGIKQRNCEMCGQGEYWHGNKMSLILDHINGINNDNRLENLRILCANCNATLDTHCVGNYKEKRKFKKEKDLKFCECGSEIASTSSKCRKCSHLSLRVKERPTYEQLIDDYRLLGYLGTSKKYSVTDNTIKRWIKSYENQK